MRGHMRTGTPVINRGVMPIILSAGGIPPWIALQGAFHDESSCWVPAVFRPAIILSHWGRTEFPHTSGTG